MMMNRRIVAAAALAALAGGLVSVPVNARTLTWSGYTWTVRDTAGAKQGPGPSVFSDDADRVFVDERGRLHLTVRPDGDGGWVCTEVFLNQSLGFGRYEWEVASRFDRYAPNVVAGLFTYRDPQAVAEQTDGEVGNGVADTPHEIDIELTRAFDPAVNVLHTTHDPDVDSPSRGCLTTLNGDHTTHRFDWAADRIDWASFHGHVAGMADPPNPITDERAAPHHGEPAAFSYAGPVVPADLDERVHLNFWVFNPHGDAPGPADGQAHELIITRFVYTPAE